MCAIVAAPRGKHTPCARALNGNCCYASVGFYFRREHAYCVLQRADGRARGRWMDAYAHTSIDSDGNGAGLSSVCVVSIEHNCCVFWVCVVYVGMLCNVCSLFCGLFFNHCQVNSIEITATLCVTATCDRARTIVRLKLRDAIALHTENGVVRSDAHEYVAARPATGA